MHLITGLLLVNRIYIKEGYVPQVLAIFEKYNMSCLLSPNDAKQNGPFIYQIYKYVNCELTILEFKNFVTELSPMLDLYQGVRPFTFAEFYVKVHIEQDNVLLSHATRNEIVVAVDYENDVTIMETLKPLEEKIIKLKTSQQRRISYEDYRSMKETSFALI